MGCVAVFNNIIISLLVIMSIRSWAFDPTEISNRPRPSSGLDSLPWLFQLREVRIATDRLVEINQRNALTTSPLAPMDLDNHFDTTGLKEIGNLASWTVSTYKPGCGVEALRDEDTSLFWQCVSLSVSFFYET